MNVNTQNCTLLHHIHMCLPCNYMENSDCIISWSEIHNGLYADLCGGKTQHNNTESQKARQKTFHNSCRVDTWSILSVKQATITNEC